MNVEILERQRFFDVKYFVKAPIYIPTTFHNIDIKVFGQTMVIFDFAYITQHHNEFYVNDNLQFY